MRIDNALRHFIHLDSEAAIETEGLVGKKIVTITPGGADAAEITDGGVIPSKKSGKYFCNHGRDRINNGQH